jgi:hypothetical protein
LTQENVNRSPDLKEINSLKVIHLPKGYLDRVSNKKKPGFIKIFSPMPSNPTPIGLIIFLFWAHEKKRLQVIGLEAFFIRISFVLFVYQYSNCCGRIV